MAMPTPNLAEIALQLETTTAQLRVLSMFPEIQRESEAKKAVEGIKDQVTTMQKRVEELSSEVQSLRDTTKNMSKKAEAGYGSPAMNNICNILADTTQRPQRQDAPV